MELVSSYYRNNEKGYIMQTATTEAVLTLNELADRLKVSPNTVRGLYRKGVIPGIKLGHRTLRFDYSAVLAALKAADEAGVYIA